MKLFPSAVSLDTAWSRLVGGHLQPVAEASSIGLIKSLAVRGVGVGMLTALDALSEIEAGTLVFLPLSDERIDLSTLSIASASGRTLSLPASLLLQHLGQAMEMRNVPVF